jgi:putative membrane protein
MKKISYIKKAILLVTFVAPVLLFASCNTRQDSQHTTDVAQERNEARFDDNEQKKDAQFIVNAAEINLKQIQLGQLAQKKGSTTHVKELGKMMEDTHTKSQRDLSALARKKKITIPTSLTDNAQDAYTKLDEKSGHDFDKEYSDKMVSQHKDAIKIFEDATKERHDIDINNWAIAALPDLRTNLNHSIDCQKKCEEMKSK